MPQQKRRLFFSAAFCAAAAFRAVCFFSAVAFAALFCAEPAVHSWLAVVKTRTAVISAYALVLFIQLPFRYCA